MRCAAARWNAARILDVIDAVSVPYSEPHDRRSFKEQAYSQLMEIWDILDPLSSLHKNTAAEKPKISEKAKIKFAEMLSGRTYSTVDEIISAMRSAQSTLGQEE